LQNPLWQSASLLHAPQMGCGLLPVVPVVPVLEPPPVLLELAPVVLEALLLELELLVPVLLELVPVVLEALLLELDLLVPVVLEALLEPAVVDPAVVELAGFAPQWPVRVSQTLPLAQSPFSRQLPQNPLTQPSAPQLAAVSQAWAGTHWPLSQASPARHWVLAVHGTHWPGLPGWQTGEAVPWQSRLLKQPRTQLCAWQMKAFTQSSLVSQPAPSGGAPQWPPSGPPRQAWASRQSLRWVQGTSPALVPVVAMPVVPPTPVVPELPRSMHAPLCAQKVPPGHCSGGMPRQLPQRALMQNSPERVQSVSSVQPSLPVVPPVTCSPVLPPPPASAVGCGRLWVPPHAPIPNATASAAVNR